ncbi:MAG: polymerase principal sigma factor HrdB [Planctomycetota bacterium]
MSAVLSGGKRSAVKKAAVPKKNRVRDRISRQQLVQEVQQLLGTEIRFVYAAEFEKLDGDLRPVREAEALLSELRDVSIAARGEVSVESTESLAIPSWSATDPLLTFEQEQVLFKALNLLRYRANRLRSRLSPDSPSAARVREIRGMLELAEQIRGQLVRSNLRLVSSIARRFSVSHHDVDEFSSEGSMILLGAIDRFDYSRRFRFSTYATHSIQRHFFRASKVRQRRRLRFPCTSAEILSEVPEAVSELPICTDPQQVVHDLLRQAAEVLDDREYRILLQRFGLEGSGGESQTLREIAADLGVSKERVRQLQLKALEKLRPLLDPSHFNLDLVVEEVEEE